MPKSGRDQQIQKGWEQLERAGLVTRDGPSLVWDQKFANSILALIGCTAIRKGGSKLQRTGTTN
jgi:hypothetical protein